MTVHHDQQPILLNAIVVMAHNSSSSSYDCSHQHQRCYSPPPLLPSPSPPAPPSPLCPPSPPPPSPSTLYFNLSSFSSSSFLSCYHAASHSPSPQPFTPFPHSPSFRFAIPSCRISSSPPSCSPNYCFVVSSLSFSSSSSFFPSYSRPNR